MSLMICFFMAVGVGCFIGAGLTMWLWRTWFSCRIPHIPLEDCPPMPAVKEPRRERRAGEILAIAKTSIPICSKIEADTNELQAIMSGQVLGEVAKEDGRYVLRPFDMEI